MNLSVRRNKTRRGPGIGKAFGLPVRVKMPLPSVKEPSDDLDGITELDLTVDDPQQSCQPEMTSGVQGNHLTGGSVPTASCSSKVDRKNDQTQSTCMSHRTAQNQEQSKESERKEDLFVSQREDSHISINRQWNKSTIQEHSQSSTTNPHSATLNINDNRQQQAEAWPSCQQTIQAQEIPVTEGQNAQSSNSILTGRSSTFQKQNSSSLAPVVGHSGSFQQQPHIPQINHSGQLQTVPVQHPSMGFASGYPSGMQYVNPVVPATPQAQQDVIVVKGKCYQRLGTIGKGGSSKVYQAFDGKRICAIKYVNLEEADDFIVQSYVNEIDLLKKLQGNDNIIKLFDWELSQEKSAIILVMECGSIDLAGFLRKNRAKITEGELQGFWRQMLEAVHVIHQQGIIHSDLKPANFLLVEGRLKLIDFGIAHTLQEDKTSIELDTQVGTLNFMSPEAFQDISHAPRFDSAGNAKPKMKIGRPSDVWSLGCILYMMVYGRTPFQHITNHVIKLQCIMDPSHEIEFRDIKDKNLLHVMKGCLRRNPKERYAIPHLLAHPFINSSSHDPLVEIEDKMFDCLMEFAKADVNSPRSIRAVSQNFCKQLLAGNKISLSSAVPNRRFGPVHSQHAVPPRQAPGPAVRHPLVGIDVQALNQAQKALKPPQVSGNDKYMRWDTNEPNKENADLNVVLKRELAVKYRNAIPLDISESTFEQSWNTTTGR